MSIIMHQIYVSVCWFSLFIVYWTQTINQQSMLLSIVGSIIYAILEIVYHRFVCGESFTTKEQFLANLILMPWMIESYHQLITHQLIRIVLFPFNIWLFEIIMGFAMIWILGTNPSWHYRTPYSFYGQISLECYFRWVLLGLFQELIYAVFLYQMSQISS